MRRNSSELWQVRQRKPNITTAPWRAALFTVVALALPPALANAGPLDDVHEATLDIDHDGKPDRAALVRDDTNHALDLYIYSGRGDEKLDLSRAPTLLKKGLAEALVLEFAPRGNGSLVVQYGCGGCSNDWTVTLTIVHRAGAFVVGGVTCDWDTRSGLGTCDINLLTGKGTLSRNLGKARPISGKFTPVKLADWSKEKRPKACE